MITLQILSSLVLLTACAFPANFSWSNVNSTTFLPPNLNQNFPNKCESSWAFATVNALSSRIKIRISQHGFNAPPPSLSPQVLIECDQNNVGCLGGEPAGAYRWIRKNNITDDSCSYYKAKGTGRQCTSRSKCQVCTAKNRCVGQPNSKIYSINGSSSLSGVQQMIDEIYNYGPISCGISMTDSLKAYTGGVFQDKSGATMMNHYVMVYGWGENATSKWWNVMNSYGPAWGEEGSFRIVRGTNNLGIQSLCYYGEIVDTWSKDQRNQTLPNQMRGKEENGKDMNKESKSVGLNLPKYLGPSKSMYSPDFCDPSWAFSITHMLTDRLLKASKGLALRTFSVQALLNCGVGTCEKEADPFAALTFIHKYGIPEQGCQSYIASTPEHQSCSAVNNCASCSGSSIYKFTCTEVKGYKRWKVQTYASVVGVAAMKMQIENGGPIVCGIELTKTFRAYTGGIFSETTVAPKINHYVEVVGFGKEGSTEYWIGRQAFGTTWGQSGFFQIKLGSANLGIETKCYQGTGLV